MRRVTFVVVLGIGLLAGCSGGASHGEGDDLLLPPGFTQLEAATVADDLAAAMRAVGSAAYTVEVSLVGPEGSRVEERSGVAHWYDDEIDFDLSWRVSGDDGAMMAAQGGAVIVGDAAYVSGDWVRDYATDAHQWVRFAADDPDVPSHMRSLIDVIVEQTDPEIPLALLSRTSQLRPVDIDADGVGVWYEGVVPTSPTEVTNVVVGGLLLILEEEEVSELTYRLLVDQDNVPQELTAEAAVDGGQVTFAAGYRDWGGFDGIQPPADALEWADLASGH